MLFPDRLTSRPLRARRTSGTTRLPSITCPGSTSPSSGNSVIVTRMCRISRGEVALPLRAATTVLPPNLSAMTTRRTRPAARLRFARRLVDSGSAERRTEHQDGHYGQVLAASGSPPKPEFVLGRAAILHGVGIDGTCCGALAVRAVGKCASALPTDRPLSYPKEGS